MLHWKPMGARAATTELTRGAVKGLAASWDRVRGPATGITVLIYHRVGADSGGQMTMSTDLFDEQMRWLSANHKVISLDDAVTLLLKPEPVPPSIVVTFDDGTTDWVENALPVLEQHGVPATFYVATDFVERRLPFPSGGEPISWAALEVLAASPLATIGSHTHRHVLLDRLDPSEIDEELDRSIELLRDRIGVDPVHFAYPKAVSGSGPAQAAVRRRFTSAVIAGTRANPAGADLHNLHRSPVQASDAMTWFKRKAAGGMRLEDDLRRLANRHRYRGATR